MTSERITSSNAPLRAYRFGKYFAQLSEPNSCQPVQVKSDFWQNGISMLPPGRLISQINSDKNWMSWERHPNGEEFILQLSGTLELIFELDGSQTKLILQPNDFVIVPPGVWHTANVPLPGSALFITPGEGTENRERH